jgi:ABC-2 type transport system permease protein
MATAETSLTPVTSRGWRMGLTNMLAKENSEWWKTRLWLGQSILWVLLADGVMLATLVQTRGQAEGTGATENKELGLLLFSLFAGIATSIGAIVRMQDALIGEKESGTAAWVLSKPLSREALVLSKAVANSLGFLVTACVIPGVIAYMILATLVGGSWPVAQFAGVIAFLALNLEFYLTFTLMLGAFNSKRGAVIGLPLAILFGWQLLLGPLPLLKYVMPWYLLMPLTSGGTQQSLAGYLMKGEPLPTITPIVCTAVLSLLFVVVAVWRFKKEEF